MTKLLLPNIEKKYNNLLIIYVLIIIYQEYLY